MYEGIATGKNKNYGQKGDRILFANDSLKFVKMNDIARKIKYAGSGRLVIRDFETGREIKILEKNTYFTNKGDDEKGKE